MHNTLSSKDREGYSLSLYWGENLLEMQFSAFTLDLPNQKALGAALCLNKPLSAACPSLRSSALFYYITICHCLTWPSWVTNTSSSKHDETFPVGHVGFTKGRFWFSFSTWQLKGHYSHMTPKWSWIQRATLCLSTEPHRLHKMRGWKHTSGSFLPLIACDPTTFQLERLWWFLCLYP